MKFIELATWLHTVYWLSGPLFFIIDWQRYSRHNLSTSSNKSPRYKFEVDVAAMPLNFHDWHVEALAEL